MAGVVKAGFTGVFGEVGGLACLRPEQVEIIVQVGVCLCEENSIFVYPVQRIICGVVLVCEILLSSRKSACVDVEEFFISLV